MDPNVALAVIRTLAKNILNLDYADNNAYDLAEVIDSLDSWLKDGGFLPDAWGEGKR